MIKMQNLSASAAAVACFVIINSCCLAATDMASKPAHTTKPKTPAIKRSASYSSLGWRPSPALRVRLGALNQFENYAIRPPRGYTQTVTNRGPQTYYYWTGDPHDNGAVPELLIETDVKLSGTPMDNQTLYAEEVAKTKRQYLSVTFSPFETGTLNGLSFFRAYYRGNDQRGFMHHGVVYVMVDGTEVYSVSGDDTDPYSDKTLPIMEAAARTFQKPTTEQ
jgi:hypothetical protein